MIDRNEIWKPCKETSVHAAVNVKTKPHSEFVVSVNWRQELCTKLIFSGSSCHFLCSFNYCINNLSAICTKRWLSDEEEEVIHKNRGVDSHNNSSYSKRTQCLSSARRGLVITIVCLSLTKRTCSESCIHFSKTSRTRMCWRSFSASRQLLNKCPRSRGCPPEAAKQNWQNWVFFG